MLVIFLGYVMTGYCKKTIFILWIFGMLNLVFAASFVDGQGQLIVDGEPFFMMGFFADSYASAYTDKMETIDSLSAAGFNTAKTSVMGEPWQTISALNHANSRGMKLIYDGAQNNEWKDFHLKAMKKYQDHSGLLGWYIVDDSHGVPPDTIQMYHEQAKAIDPNHITTHSMALSCWNNYGIDHIRERIQYCDVLQMQSYPIGKEPIDEVYHDMRKTLAAAAPYNTPVVIDLQLFNWQLTGHDWGRWPTPKEVELMTWLAIVAGVDGYLYYTYYDVLAEPAQSLAFSQPELWKTAQKIAYQANQIKPILLDHQNFITYNPKSNLYYGHWVTDEQAVVVAVNTSPKDSLTVSIPVVNSHTVMESLGGGSAAGFEIIRGFLKGTLPPESVQIFRLSSNATNIRREHQAEVFRLNLFPNPGNSNLHISVNATAAGPLKINIYSLTGQRISTIASSLKKPGRYHFTVDFTPHAAGVYIVQAEFGTRLLTRKWAYLP